jgi:UDP-N-acetylglucosamine 2-epimerase (non-hydrolysing)
MARGLRIMTVFGTRPEAIKLAPVIMALQRSPHVESLVTVTAQHREMLDQVLDLFEIVPDYDLGIQRPGQTLTGITVRALEGLDSILADSIDLVVVQGDTTTTFAAALMAFYHHIPVAHVEAGLRTGNPESPFPEEINRRLTTQLSSLHLAPTPRNVTNLRSEGVPAERIVCTGNTVIDALNHVIAMKPDYGNPSLDRLNHDKRRVVLVTVHRRESWGDSMDGIGRALARLAADPTLLLVVPLHRNPVVRASIVPSLEGLENVLVIEPLPYGAFARLIDRCDLVLTDSGGIQEEAPSRGKPVLVLRDVTERPEGVEAGTVALVGTDEDHIVAMVRSLLSDRAEYRRMARTANPYGDGRAATRTIDSILWFFGLSGRPDDFQPEPTHGLPDSGT